MLSYLSSSRELSANAGRVAYNPSIGLTFTIITYENNNSFTNNKKHYIIYKPAV